MARQGFWDAPETARAVVAEFKDLKERIVPFEGLQASFQDFRELVELLEEDKDPDILAELAADAADLTRRLTQLELAAMLDGRHDKLDCYLSIHAGAGGTDSSDWAQMLLRMYSRWTEHRGFSFTVIDYVPNEEAGLKRAVLRVTGSWAYGYLRSEIGVHRLVRISPFDFNQRRHTSFASVDALPQFEEEEEIDIGERDLRIETYRSSGAGGQHVNVTDSAVRITHLPTGIIVQCQNERSQHRNRAEAMRILKARLVRLRQLEKETELKAMYSEKGEIAWGNQIRSYILHPYSLVKDHRTACETPDVQSVLDGALDPFMKAFLMQRKP
jgi:peptide chain release factor 2